MTDLCGIAITGGAPIAPDAIAYWRGQPISAAVFDIDGRAAGLAIAGSVAPIDLINLVRQGRIAARALVDDDRMLVGVELYQSGTVSATCWRAGLPDEWVPWLAQPYVDSYSFARVEAQLVGLTQPPRPAGTGEPVQLELAGDITEVQTAALVSEIKNAADKSIVLVLDSGGGLVEPTMKIYYALRAHGRHVTTHILKAMSAAAVIALAGDRRTISAAGIVMLHDANLEPGGRMGSRAMRAVADKVDYASAEMARIVANRCGTSMQTAKGWMAAETRFTAAAAVRAGLCHALADAPPVVAARRCGTSETARGPQIAAAWRLRLMRRFGGFSQP